MPTLTTFLAFLANLCFFPPEAFSFIREFRFLIFQVVLSKSRLIASISASVSSSAFRFSSDEPLASSFRRLCSAALRTATVSCQQTIFSISEALDEE